MLHVKPSPFSVLPNLSSREDEEVDRGIALQILEPKSRSRQDGAWLLHKKRHAAIGPTPASEFFRLEPRRSSFQAFTGRLVERLPPIAPSSRTGHIPDSQTISLLTPVAVAFTIPMAHRLRRQLLPFFLLSILLASTALAQSNCYHANGVDQNERWGGSGSEYSRCGSPNEHSMCCRWNTDVAPDTCRSDGLCVNDGNIQLLWRESCTDPTWESEGCLKLCYQGRGT